MAKKPVKLPPQNKKKEEPVKTETKTRAKIENPVAKTPAGKSLPAEKTIAKSKTSRSKAKTQKKPAKKTRKRKAHVTRPTPEEELIIKQRQTLVSDLRRAGATIRQISEHLKNKGFEHCSPATVFADLETNLTDINALRLTSTELLVTQELDKIDDWEFTVYSDFKNASRKVSIDERIKIGNFLVALQNQRDKFLAISKTQKSDNNAKDALAALLGRSPEELPDDKPGN